MKLLDSILVGFLASLVSSAPTLLKRAPTDEQIINYALTLEHLENVFYRTGLAAFSASDFANAGYDSSVRDNLEIIGADEATHVSFLTAALDAAGITPVSECNYNFGVTDVDSFLLVASILEGIGVSGYLGAAADVASKMFLSASASVLTVEARHSSYLRAALGQTPFAYPFDNPLTYSQAYSIAAQFIASCPGNTSEIAVKLFPSITVTNTGYPTVSGSTLELSVSNATLPAGVTNVYAAYVSILGPVFANVTYADGCIQTVVPDGVNGQTYMLLTSSTDGISDDNTLAGPVILEIENY